MNQIADALKRNKAFLIICIGALFFNMGSGIQNTIYTNFVSNELQIGADSVGMLAGIREVPGLLTAVLALATLFFTESVLAALCMGLVALGLFSYSTANSFVTLVLATTIMSTGQHLYFPLQSAMVMKVSKQSERAARLGTLNSVAAFATLSATLLVRSLTPVLTDLQGMFNYRIMFRVAAVIALLGGVFQLSLRRGGKADLRKALVFRWQYKTYYILTFLAGSRRHMNQTFATLALVSLHGVDVGTIATLFLVSNVMSIFSRPLLGKLIDKWGEGKSLTLNYSVVSLLFLGYAFVGNVNLLYVIFIVDQLFLGFEIAITTHLDKICDRADMSASLAMGGTISHISAVFIPVLGGFLWKAVSPQATFLSGLALCLVSLMQAYRLPHVTHVLEESVA